MRFVVVLILLSAHSGLVLADTPSTTGPSTLTPLQQQRALYTGADQALNNNQPKKFKQLLKKLGSYPLKPYLEYEALSQKIDSTPREEIDDFLFNYPNSLLATKLTQQWLRELASKKLWDLYIHYYNSELADTELTCWYLEARIETEDNTALDRVDRLWNQSKSLPSGCDNIIASWKAAGRLTTNLIWERFKKSVDSGNSSLATYLSSELPTVERSYAQAYMQIANAPGLLRSPEKFKQDNIYMSEVILKGIAKQATSDAEKALHYFKSYSKDHSFTKDQLTSSVTQLANQLLKQKYYVEATELISLHSDIDDLTLLDNLLRYALSQQDWERVNAWLQRYPAELKQEDRWRYWMARTMDALQIRDFMDETSTNIYADLSGKRSFYGFISAIKLQTAFSLVDHPIEMDKLQWASIESQPGFLRARELFLTDNKSAASQEWFFTIKQLSTNEIIHAAHLASKWDNSLLTIQTFSAAKYYDDLTPRFPIKFEDSINEAVEQTQVDKLFITSIIRQESVFTEDAKSPAKAYGLMQLLPSTAQHVAKNYKIRYSNNDLVKANKNIRLGSRYLKDLLDMFEGNHILATAAYNAGPGRVRKWQKQTNGKLPFDIWIEVIPFNETRQYVQNVLAFRVIYAYRLGLPQEFVSQAEMEQLL